MSDAQLLEKDYIVERTIKPQQVTTNNLKAFCQQRTTAIIKHIDDNLVTIQQEELFDYFVEHKLCIHESGRPEKKSEIINQLIKKQLIINKKTSHEVKSMIIDELSPLFCLQTIIHEKETDNFLAHDYEKDIQLHTKEIINIFKQVLKKSKELPTMTYKHSIDIETFTNRSHYFEHHTKIEKLLSHIDDGDYTTSNPYMRMHILRTRMLLDIQQSPSDYQNTEKHIIQRIQNASPEKIVSYLKKNEEIPFSYLGGKTTYTSEGYVLFGKLPENITKLMKSKMREYNMQNQASKETTNI